MVQESVVYLTKALLGLINVREYGFPTGMNVGSFWRSSCRNITLNSSGEMHEDYWIMSCILPGDAEVDPDQVIVQNRRVAIVAEPGDVLFPPGWSEAMAQYCMDWPASATTQALLTKHLSDAERIKQSRAIAARGGAEDLDPDSIEFARVDLITQAYWLGMQMEYPGE